MDFVVSPMRHPRDIRVKSARDATLALCLASPGHPRDSTRTRQFDLAAYLRRIPRLVLSSPDHHRGFKLGLTFDPQRVSDVHLKYPGGSSSFN